MAGASEASEIPSVVGVDRRAHAGGEYLIEPSEESIICAYLGSDVGRDLPLEQVASGRLHEFILRPGVVQLMPEGLPRTYRHHATADHVHLHIPRGATERAADELGLRSTELMPQVGAPDAKVFHLALSLLGEGGGHGDRPAEPLREESLATELLLHLYGRYGVWARRAKDSATLPEKAFARVEEFAEDRLSEEISLDELAEVSGFARSRFSELFRASTGLSPYRFVLERRLSRAREMLSRTTLPIAEVAGATGFYDQSHLTRQMRRRLGVTPGELRA